MMGVKLYSTGCPRCKILKSKLDENGIPYEEVNDLKEMQELGIRSAPYLLVNGELMDYAKSLVKLKEISYKMEGEA